MMFYDSYYEASKKVPRRVRHKFWISIIEYVYEGKKPQLSGSALMAFDLIRPMIDLSLNNKKNNKKKESVGNVAADAAALAPSRPVVVYGGTVGKPTLETVLAAATGVMGVSADYARWWYREMEARGWANTDGSAVSNANWRPTLKAWWNRRKPSEMSDIEHDRLELAAKCRVFTAGDWELCRSRCRHCGESGCTKGARIPPQLMPRPFPPEECPAFNRRAEA